MTPNTRLNNQQNSGKMNSKNVLLWQKLIRLIVAALYVVCEMQLGQLPDDVKIGGKKESNGLLTDRKGDVNTKPE